MRTHGIVLLALLLLPPATAHAATLKGQVVCSGCWEEADRKTTPYGTAADLKCAARCEKSGIAAALAVGDGKEFRTYTLQAGRFEQQRRGWLKYMGKQVEITGTLKKVAGKDAIEVDGLKVLPDEEKPAAKP